MNNPKAVEIEFEYFYFCEKENKGKTKIYDCVSRHGDKLGTIKWYSAWRQYCFFPEDKCVFSGGCLIDIDKFLVSIKGVRNVING